MTLRGTGTESEASSPAPSTDISLPRRRMSGRHVFSGVMLLGAVIALALAMMGLAKVRKFDGKLTLIIDSSVLRSRMNVWGHYRTNWPRLVGRWRITAGGLALTCRC